MEELRSDRALAAEITAAPGLGQVTQAAWDLILCGRLGLMVAAHLAIWVLPGSYLAAG